MNTATSQRTVLVPPGLAQEDQSRADFYALLARLFIAPPDARLLQSIMIAPVSDPHRQSADSPLLESWRRLAMAASAFSTAELEGEFNQLFVSVGRCDVMPFASYFLTGFLHEKPLAKLRADLSLLGLSRSEAVLETEDHIAALCDVMRFLIVGDGENQPASIAAQKAFFAAHLQPWALQFCQAVTQAETAIFYKHVANFAQAFFEIEITAFEIE